MSLIWFIVGYIVSGIVVIVSVSVLHIIMAEKAGFKCLEWWTENESFINKNTTVLDIMIGVVIWPIRTIHFVCQKVPALYELYDRYDSNEFEEP
jgi:hypothetical protein